MLNDAIIDACKSGIQVIFRGQVGRLRGYGSRRPEVYFESPQLDEAIRIAPEQHEHVLAVENQPANYEEKPCPAR